VEAHPHQVPKSGPEEAPRLEDAVAKLLTRDEKGELEIVRQLRKWMDEAVTVPGTKLKVGLDAVIGLIPGIGDASSAAIGAYMLNAAHKLGVPTIVMVRMLFNLFIDALIGLIPIVGDYLDVLYKANAKNARLIEEAVVNRETTVRSSWWRLVGVFAVFLLIVFGGIVGTVFFVKWLWTAIG
jgi:hypothetical protein